MAAAMRIRYEGVAEAAPEGCHSGDMPPEGVKKVLLHSCCAVSFCEDLAFFSQNFAGAFR